MNMHVKNVSKYIFSLFTLMFWSLYLYADSESLKAVCSKDSLGNFEFKISNVSGDTIFLFDTYMERKTASFYYESEYVHRYNKKSDTYKLSLMPIGSALFTSGNGRMITGPGDTRQIIIQTWPSFTIIPPHTSVHFVMVKDALYSKMYVDDDDKYGGNINYFNSTRKGDIKVRRIKKTPDWITVEMAYSKTVDELWKHGNQPDFNVDRWQEQLCSFEKLSIPISLNDSTMFRQDLSCQSDDVSSKDRYITKRNDSDGSTYRTFTAKGIPFKMILVKGGTFTMGATPEQGGEYGLSGYPPTHSVSLDDYYIGETEVTQDLWQAVMGNNPSSFIGDAYPVEGISTDEMQRFIIALNNLTGMQFTLPSEAEWEYAARGGLASKKTRYSGSDNISDVSWYWGNSLGMTHPVATKKPNELGIYDMSGNVEEWCTSTSNSSQENTRNLSEHISSNIYVCRGGDWNSSSKYCRSSSHKNHEAIFPQSDRIGFRLALPACLPTHRLKAGQGTGQ